MLCENSSNKLHTPLQSGCLDNEAEVEVVVRYNPVEADTLQLCTGCADQVEKDAKRHGYEVQRTDQEEV